MTSTSSPFQRPFGAPKTDQIDEQKPSLFDRLQASGVTAATPPKPKPFDMSELIAQPGGLQSFWLTADEDVLKYVAHLNCVLNSSAAPPFSRNLRGRRMFSINPRYDADEAWMWIYRLLESEANKVILSDLWDEALEEPEEWSGDE